MDIAYYISDLLGQQGELTVPNLGYFVQIRMPAFYDSEAKKFFPPHYSVQFDPQIIDDDDALANHITAVKKISVTSAKYFIEKYITNLKSQSFIEDVPFANLGSFTSDGIKLTFNTNAKLNDPAFFAYPAVEAIKIGEPPIVKPITVTELIAVPEPVKEFNAAPVITPTPVDVVPEPVVIAPTPVVEVKENSQATPPYFGGELVSSRVNPGESEEEPKRLGIWIIVLIAFTVVVIALGALYKFKPGLFQKATVTPGPVTTVIKKDTVTAKPADQTLAKQDSSIKTDTPKQVVNPPMGQPAAVVTPEVKKPLPTTVESKKPAAAAAQPVSKTPVTTPPVNTSLTNTPMPEVVAKGAFVITSYVFPTRKGAMDRIAELKAKGFEQARLLTDKVNRGGNYKVILGVYNSREEGNIAKKEFMATGKLKESELSVEQNKKSLE